MSKKEKRECEHKLEQENEIERSGNSRNVNVIINEVDLSFVATIIIELFGGLGGGPLSEEKRTAILNDLISFQKQKHSDLMDALKSLNND